MDNWVSTDMQIGVANYWEHHTTLKQASDITQAKLGTRLDIRSQTRIAYTKSGENNQNSQLCKLAYASYTDFQLPKEIIRYLLPDVNLVK